MPSAEDASQRCELRADADLLATLDELVIEHLDVDDSRTFVLYREAVLDRHGVTYLIPKQTYPADYNGIEQVKEHPLADVAVERAVPLWVNGRNHEVSIMYVPSTKKEGHYAVYTTNRDVTPDEVMGLTDQYSWRWEIEIEYKTIKKHFLPTTASTDYRVRLLYFTLGVVMYNIWRLTNLTLREAVTVDLGEKPPLRAGEVVELIGFCLAPGD